MGLKVALTKRLFSRHHVLERCLETQEVIACPVNVEGRKVFVDLEKQHSVRRRTQPHHLKLAATWLASQAFSGEQPGQRYEVLHPLRLGLELGNHHVAFGCGH